MAGLEVALSEAVFSEAAFSWDWIQRGSTSRSANKIVKRFIVSTLVRDKPPQIGEAIGKPREMKKFPSKSSCAGDERSEVFKEERLRSTSFVRAVRNGTWCC